MNVMYDNEILLKMTITNSLPFKIVFVTLILHSDRRDVISMTSIDRMRLLGP